LDICVRLAIQGILSPEISRFGPFLKFGYLDIWIFSRQILGDPGAIRPRCRRNQANAKSHFLIDCFPFPIITASMSILSEKTRLNLSVKDVIIIAISAISFLYSLFTTFNGLTLSMEKIKDHEKRIERLEKQTVINRDVCRTVTLIQKYTVPVNARLDLDCEVKP